MGVDNTPPTYLPTPPPPPYSLPTPDTSSDKSLIAMATNHVINSPQLIYHSIPRRLVGTG